MNHKELNELQSLISRYCDGDLEKPELLQLSEILRENSEAAEVYIAMMTVHSDLSLMGSSSKPTEPEALDSGNGTNPDHGLPLGSLHTEGESKSLFGLGSPFLWALGFASLLVGFSLFMGLGGFFDSSSAIEPNSIAATADQGHVAKIVRKVDCDWQDDRWAVVSSSLVHAGQTLSLSRGLMELEFNSGAMITLEAPVTFTVESEMRAVLAHGKLSANIPKSAHGFRVSTPGGEAIDLGTRFGLFVTEQGVTETHVFQGEVVVKSAGADDQGHSMLLTDNMALRMGAGQPQPDPLVAVPARFTRFDFDEEESTDAPIVDRQLSLWLSADKRLQKDENDRVSSWGDLCTDSNVTSEDAWQVEATKRPMWIESAFGDRPAIRFDFKNVLVTEPIKLGTAQSICAAFKINKTLIQKTGVSEIGRQLMNMNGPPHLILGIDSNLNLVSRNYAGLRAGKKGPKGHRTVGMLKTPKELDNKPVVVVSVYDPAVNQSRLYLNGSLVAKSTAPKLAATESPRYIGAHSILPNSHFLGDVAELMIYDTGLTEEEAIALSKSIMKKYSIPVSPATKKKDEVL